MRAAYRGSDSTLRWALVGGIVVVVVIATIVAIVNGLGGNSKKSTNPPSNTIPKTTYCLWPKKVSVAAAPVNAYYPTGATRSPLNKHHLIKVERKIKNHGLALGGLLAISPTGHRLIYINSQKHIVMHAGVKNKTFKFPAEDATLNGKGNRIIYQRPSLAAHSCAKLVLMKVRPDGTHRKLMLASGAFRLANSSTISAAGTLTHDELPNGVIMLVHGQQLYAFNPAKRRISPVETAQLGTLYPTTGTTTATFPQFLVSPGLNYAAEATIGVVNVDKLPSWTSEPVTGAASLPQIAWSYNGKKLAYESAGQKNIKILNMITNKTRVIKFPTKFGLLNISSLRWSADDRFVGFNGRSLHNQGGTVSKVFIAKIGARHPRAHVVAPVKGGAGKHKTASPNPTSTPTPTTTKTKA
jgi:hypothetical protein